MHGQAELPSLHHHPPRPYCSQAATMDPQDCSLPSACLAAQMPQGTKNSKPVKCDRVKIGTLNLDNDLHVGCSDLRKLRNGILQWKLF